MWNDSKVLKLLTDTELNNSVQPHSEFTRFKNITANVLK